MGKMIESAGVHVTVDGFVSDPDGAFSEESLRGLFEALVSALDMTVLVGPEFVQVPLDPQVLEKSQASGEFVDEGGVTSFCVISKSHIAIHCWPLQRFFSMDVFSCCDFDPNIALDLVRTRLAVTADNSNVLYRRKPIDKEHWVRLGAH